MGGPVVSDESFFTGTHHQCRLVKQPSSHIPTKIDYNALCRAFQYQFIPIHQNPFATLYSVISLAQSNTDLSLIF